MKYLKEYNSDNIIESILNSSYKGQAIPNDVINCIKERSIDLLDDGYQLIYKLSIYDFKIYGFIDILLGEYSHTSDNIRYNKTDYKYLNNIYHISKGVIYIRYTIILQITSRLKLIQNIREEKNLKESELIDIVKSIYPKEDIGGFTNNTTPEKYRIESTNESISKSEIGYFNSERLLMLVIK